MQAQRQITCVATTNTREVNKIHSKSSAKVDQHVFKVELDSNADTCSVGGGVMIVNETDRFVTASPFVNIIGNNQESPDRYRCRCI